MLKGGTDLSPGAGTDGLARIKLHCVTPQILQ